MNKKFRSFLLTPLLVIPTVVGLSSCGGPEEETRTPPIECKIEFLKNNDLNSERYETDKMLVDTQIFILVNFKLYNQSTTEDTIDFRIDIPGAEYYKAYDWERGQIEPEIKTATKTDLATGKTIEIIKMGDMQFSIPANNTYYSYNYIVSVKAKQACENMKIIATFTSYYGMLKDTDKKTFDKTYSFIEK